MQSQKPIKKIHVVSEKSRLKLAKEFISKSGLSDDNNNNTKPKHSQKKIRYSQALKAVRNDDLEQIKLLHSTGGGFPEGIANEAVIRNNEEILKFLISNKSHVSLTCMMTACKNNNIKMARFLRSNGRYFHQHAILDAYDSGYLELVQALYLMGAEFPTIRYVSKDKIEEQERLDKLLKECIDYLSTLKK